MSDEQGTTGAGIKATAPERVAPPFEHAALSEPTELLDAHGVQSLEQLLSRAERWAEIQGSDKIRLPHLFVALLGAGTDPCWEWLRNQQPDLEGLKQKALLMVPAQKRGHVPAEEKAFSESVRIVLDRAKALAGKAKRGTLGVEDVYRAFFEESGAVGDQLKKWGIKIPQLFST